MSIDPTIALAESKDDVHPDVVDNIAVARLYGEPLFKVPQDLYIPPEALEIFLEAFEGPLDLLLYLIRKQNFNILDIPMAEVTGQYLRYVDQIRDTNLELAAEYLLMAAMLIEIKSRMLLPMINPEQAQEGEDPRAELVRRLLEYERMKLAAGKVDELPQINRDFFKSSAHVEKSIMARLPDVCPDDLRQAWLDVLKRAQLVQKHTITREEISVREYMSFILKNLQGKNFTAFEDLFEPENGVTIMVVTFIALLELTRESLVQITQAGAYAPIYVRLSYA